jgi:hypothetical protein
MAPEQFQGRAMPASDVYGVGATALSMLTGVEPEDLPHRGLSIDVPAALRGRSTSAPLGKLLAAMLEPDPDKRLAAVGPGLSALDRASGTRPSRAAPAPAPSQGRPSRAAPEPATSQGRRDRYRDRNRDREEKREARRERRELAMMEWQKNREQRGRQAAAQLPGVVLLVVRIALRLAQLAVFFALRVAVPLLFTLLSLVFGKGMRTAAGTVNNAGKIAIDAIGRARDAVSELGREREERVRVATEASRAAAPGVRIAADDVEAEREHAAEEEAEARRERTGRR